MQWIPVVLGLAVGFLLALTGAGGAILSVPLLVFGVGLSLAEAGPVALLAPYAADGQVDAAPAAVEAARAASNPELDLSAAN